MGYPMTWQRVVKRNCLDDGDYGTTPRFWQPNVNMSMDTDKHERVAAIRRERIVQYEQRSQSLAGDIRRLEADARDEQSLCKHIAERTGIDADTVAAVLLEFFAT